MAEVRGELEVAVGPYAEMLQGEPELNLEDLPTLPELETLFATTDAVQRGLRSPRSVQQSFISEVDVARRSVVPGFEVQAYFGYGQAPGQVDFGAGIAVPLPLINRGQGSIAAAEFRAVKAGYDVHALSLAAQQQVRAQLHAVEHRYDAVRRFQEETEGLDERLMVESTARYRDARMTILELVDAFQARTNNSPAEVPKRPSRKKSCWWGIQNFFARMEYNFQTQLCPIVRLRFMSRWMAAWRE